MLKYTLVKGKTIDELRWLAVSWAGKMYLPQHSWCFVELLVLSKLTKILLKILQKMPHIIKQFKDEFWK